MVIVGAGSSGCPLAARLSDNKDRSVLLLEAGNHFKSTEDLPAELKFAGVTRAAASNHPSAWSFPTTLSEGVGYVLPRGKVVGGSSSINGCLFTRGLPEDFDAWAAAGNDEWTFEAVLPYFKSIENDLDFADEHHGRSGPVPVQRPDQAEWPPLSRAFVEACRAAGFAYDEDMNAPSSLGVGPIPQNAIDGVRMDAGAAFLRPILNRPNLTLKPNTTVLKVLFRATTAIGVLASQMGREEVFLADEVILSAGAINTAHLLMLSGVGPAKRLQSVGIPVVHDAAYVGRNFSDHCLVRVWFRSRGGGRLDPTRSAGALVALHYSSSELAAHSDMMLLPSAIPLNRQVLHGAGPIESARVLLNASRSLPLDKFADFVRRGWHHNVNVMVMDGDARGAVSLASADPEQKPLISHNYLSTEKDRRKLREAVRLAVQLLSSDPFLALGAGAISVKPRNLASDEALDGFIRRHLASANHLSGTARMGPESDETAVVDQQCRVHGVRHLRVVDASVMPTVVRRGPNATAMMLGERAAAFFDG